MTFTITLPNDGELIVATGQTVDFTTPLIKNNIKKEVKVTLASNLRIHPKKIFGVLKKFVGEKIKKGDVIAQNKSFLIKQKYLSEYDGIIKEVNHNEGYIIIDSETETQSSIPSYFKGEIAEIKKVPNSDYVQLKVKVGQNKEYDLKEVSDFFGGKILYCKKNTIANLSEEDVQGNVACISSLQPYEQIKLETLGVIGFVSSHSLPKKTTVPHAKLSKIADLEKLIEDKLPYCTVDKVKCEMYAYD